jgi:hypothetical protein
MKLRVLELIFVLGAALSALRGPPCPPTMTWPKDVVTSSATARHAIAQTVSVTGQS